MKKIKGFTLIEVLVALVLLSIMALLAWRGLDGMSRAATQTSTYEQSAERLAVTLAQWSQDWDAVVETGAIKALDFDGLVVRMTRRGPVGQGDASAGVSVVAWTLRAGQLERYAASATTDKKALQAAWLAASRWARTPLPEDARLAVRLLPATSWQLFYSRGGAWSNPLSEDTALPDGVRLIVNLPEGHSLAGKVTKDWVSPSLGATQ